MTPVFGTDFPAKCLKPDDEKYGNMMIDPNTTEFCARQAKAFRNDVSISQSPTPQRMFMSPQMSTPSRQHVSRDRKAKRLAPTYASPYNSPYTSDLSDDGYSTGTPSPSITPAQTPMTTPGPRYHHAFTPINRPRLVPRSVPYPERRLPSPRDILQQSEQHNLPAYTRPIFPMTPPSTGRMSSPEVSPKTIPAKIPRSMQEMNGFGQDQTIGRQELEWLSTRIRPEEEYAAYILLGMKLARKSPAQAAYGLGISITGLAGEEFRASSA